LSDEETGWLKAFLRYNHPDLQWDPARDSATVFQRALYHSELHSELYTQVRTRSSVNIALSYAEGVYYGTVHKFFLLQINGQKLRVALVSSYPAVPALPSEVPGLPRINLNKPFKLGRIVNVNAILNKVLLAGPSHRTSVIPVPQKKSM